MPSKSTVNVVLGSQWGDEGKGKVVDLLANHSDIVCRCQGGSNAGHTVVVGSTSYFFHLLPSGITTETTKVVIGNGVVLHIPTLIKEFENNAVKGLVNLDKRLVISDRAHIVFDFHQEIDGLIETLKGKKSIGTTKRGIGPTYATKSFRNGLRLCDLVGSFEKFSEKFRDLVKFFKLQFPDMKVDVESELNRYKLYADQLRPMVCDTVPYIHNAMADNQRILVEGANATMLDIDFGTYPYVTSSNCSIGSVCTGLGIPANSIANVYAVVKAYTTRVGAGAFPTELTDDIGMKLQEVGQEFGTTTGRRRRCGWLDLVVVKYSNMLNGYTSLAVTKLDVLDDLDELKICVAYKHNGVTLSSFPASLDILNEVEVEYITLHGWKQSIKDVKQYDDLPTAARNYLQQIEATVGVQVQFVGVGKSRAAMIKRY